MKTKILSIALAALTIGLLGSCSKINERIDSLEERIDGIGNGSIASIEQQIAAINQSINDLKAADETIGGKIADLKTSAEAQQALIDALKEADRVLGQKDDALEARIATLEGQAAAINGRIKTLEDADKAINTRIDELKTYIDEGIGKTKDWASATFATLEQHQQTAADLATLSVTVSSISTTLAEVQTSITGLDTKIDGIDAALQGRIADAKTELEGKIADLKTELEGKMAEAISTSETTLKGWVNEQLSAYCTTARMEAVIADLQSEIDALKDSNADKAKIEELETSLDKLSADLSQAKADIKSAYEKAIKDAIEGNDGYITETIKNAIDDANTSITALTGRVETLELTVVALSGDVDALKAMIQTVSVIPAYNDGSLKAEGGILTINCVITPKDAVDGLTKDNFTVLTSEVLTKSGLYGTIAIANDEDLVLDTDNGTATIRVDVSAVLPAEADKALTVALNVKNGISDYTTGFVPVYAAAAPGPVLPEGALAGRFSVSASKQVQFSKGNLVATIDASGTPTAWKFAANQYDYLGEGGANETIGTAAGDIDLFGWSTEATKYGISISTDYDDYSGDFVDWGKNIDNKGTWRTLSNDEWVYLFKTRNNASSLYKYGVTVCGKTNCVVIAPDGFTDTIQTSYDATTWATAEAAGLVCLPAAGYRNGSSVLNVGDGGYYWSSTASGSNFAYYVYFFSDYVYPGYDDYRDDGSSVRLITDVEGSSPVEPESVKEDPLSGKFSVGAGKQVQFSKGNLVATIDAAGTPTAWKFAANQYDCLGEGGVNKTIGSAAGDIDLFGWSTAATKYGISTSTSSSSYSGDFVDWGTTIGDGSTWRTLSQDESVYLFESRTNASSLYKCGVTVCGKENCLIIAPDNWDTSANPIQDTYDATAWATAEAAGLVCLPAAGNRQGSDVKNGNYGFYWSSTAYSGGVARSVFFNSSNVFPDDYDRRDYGISVRLITDVEGSSPVEPEPVKEDPLSGKFSVSASKQVQFSKGNLVATIDAAGTPTAWKFAANQYDCLGEGGANKTIGTAAGDVDLFGWSTAATTYGISTSTNENDYSGDFVDWGKNIGDGSTWRTLSKDEWVYLFETRTNASGLYKYGVTVCGKTNCVVIAPDGFTGTIETSYDATAWAIAEAAGLVCLPAAGRRYGPDVSYVGGSGHYWSSTASDSNYAYLVSFSSSAVSPGSYGLRNFGFSVRLITESK